MRPGIDKHPQFSQILDWIAKGEKIDIIATKLRPPVHRSTLFRYMRDRVRPALQGPASVVNQMIDQGLVRQDITPEQAMSVARNATKVSLAAQPLLDRMKKHRDTVDTAILNAQVAKDGKTIASLIGADYKGMELEARMTGLLSETSGTTINVGQMLVLPQAGQVPMPALPAGDVIDIEPE